MADDYQSSYQKGRDGTYSSGPGYHQGQADRYLKNLRDHHAEQARIAAQRRQSWNQPQSHDGPAGPRGPQGPGFYEEHPRLDKLSNVLAAILFLFGATIGVLGAVQAGVTLLPIIVTALICGGIGGGAGKLLPMLVVFTLRLVAGLAILALGLAIIVGVVMVVLAVIRLF